MRNILLKIEYDGTDFSGWQRQPQPEVRTVQDQLEQALSRVCGGPVQIDGTGRTDAGVHALGQCATFSGDFGIPTERIKKAVNDILAGSRLKGGPVRILSAQEVPGNFHARFSAVGKTYVYRIFNSPSMPVFLRNYRYHVKKPLDVAAMAKAAAAFQGSHDFEAFMAMGSNPQETTVREIFGIHVSCDGGGDAFGNESPEIRISVTGDGFLYNMVRIIAGTLTDVGLGRIPAESVPGIIAGCDRQKAGHTAPPQGLYMAEVYFDRDLMMRRAQGPWTGPGF
ncbi:MAG: tRNA pseudouridine(38-40) synthase TruA [Anaerovoracaceae bacterium]